MILYVGMDELWEMRNAMMGGKENVYKIVQGLLDFGFAKEGIRLKQVFVVAKLDTRMMETELVFRFVEMELLLEMRHVMIRMEVNVIKIVQDQMTCIHAVWMGQKLFAIALKVLE